MGHLHPYAGSSVIGCRAPEAAIRTEAETALNYQLSLFKPFIAGLVLPRLPLSFRRDMELERLVRAHRMFGKMTVVVLAKTKK